MSNVWYDKALTSVGRALLDLDSLSDPRIIAIEEDLYTFSQTHEFLSDIPAGARIATTTMAAVDFGTIEGWFDASDVVFTTPTGSQVVKALIIYEDTGVEATSPLLLFIDEANIIPVTTETGKDLQIGWQGTAIARL